MKFKEGYVDRLQQLAKYNYFMSTPIDKQEFFGKWIEWEGGEIEEIKEKLFSCRAKRHKKKRLCNLLDDASTLFRSDPCRYISEVGGCIDGFYEVSLSFEKVLQKYQSIDALLETILGIKHLLNFLEINGGIIADNHDNIRIWSTFKGEEWRRIIDYD